MRCRKRLGLLPVRDVSETLLPGAVQNPLLEGRGPSWPGCEIMLTWTQRRTPWRATVPRGRESHARDEQRRTRQSAPLHGRAYPIGGRTPWRAAVPRGRESPLATNNGGRDKARPSKAGRIPSEGGRPGGPRSLVAGRHTSAAVPSFSARGISRAGRRRFKARLLSLRRSWLSERPRSFLRRRYTRRGRASSIHRLRAGSERGLS